MSQRTILSLTGVLVVLSLLLGACGSSTTQVPVTQAPAIQTPAITESPAEAPTTTRTGAWVDEIVFTSIDEVPNAVAQLQAGQLDMYPSQSSDPDTYNIVKADPNLAYSNSYGYWVSIMFNDAVFNNGKLNPFSNPKIREAVNWMIDRDYIVQEGMGGLGTPRYIPILSTFPDYPRYADLARPLEAKYAYNFDKANSVISAELEGMGAVKDANGKWTYKGEQIVIVGLIRSEDERKIIGNYACDQFEKLGFACERQVRTRTELAPIWQQGVVENGEFNFYTGTNYYQNLQRDEG